MKIILEWRAGFTVGTKRVEFPYNSIIEFNNVEDAMHFVSANDDIVCRWYVGKFATLELILEARI